MKDSTEESKKQDHNESDLHPIPHSSIILTIFDSILQAFFAILRFFGFKRNAAPPYSPAPSSLEDCYTAGSNPPSTAVDPPHDDSEEESEYYYYRPHVPPPPPWSTGGGGQID